MQPCPPLQFFLESLAEDHGIDLLFPNARLTLEQPGIGTLMLECVAPNRLVLAQRYLDDDGGVTCPMVILFTGYPLWYTIALHSDHGCTYAADISEDGHLESIKSILQADIARICYEWAEALENGGWTDRAVVIARDPGDDAIADAKVSKLLAALGMEVAR